MHAAPCFIGLATPQLQVRGGKGSMPAFRKRLSAEEVQAVARFVLEQAASDAW